MKSVSQAGLPVGARAASDPGPLLALAYPDRIAQLRSGSRYRLRNGRRPVGREDE